MTPAASRSHDVFGRCCCAHSGPNLNMQCMNNWDRISGNWTQWKGRVRERWGKLTDDQLDVVAGRRDQLSGRIQEVYGVTKDEADRQLSNWQRNLAVDYEETEIVLEDDAKPEETQNGRG
jgi:uncharacterized protein YjbJ (UPF0337 family)